MITATRYLLYFGSLLLFFPSCIGPVIYRDITPQGYAQSASVPTEDFQVVYISGQVPLNPRGELVGLGDLEAQTDQVFQNIGGQLRQHGGTLADLVRIDCYFTDLTQLDGFRAARDRYVNVEAPPTSTAVQVARLVDERFLIEISAVAVVRQTVPRQPR